MMSRAHVSDLKENSFGRTVCSLSLVVIALIFSELRRERNRPRTQKTKKSQI